LKLNKIKVVGRYNETSNIAFVKQRKIADVCTQAINIASIFRNFKREEPQKCGKTGPYILKHLI